MKRFSLQVLLLTLLLCTAISSTLIVYFLSMRAVYDSLQQFSTQLLDRTTRFIDARIDCLLQGFEQLTKIGADVAEDHSEMNLQNKDLVSYLLNQLKDTEFLSSYFVGKPNGSYILSFDLSLVQNITNPPPPADAVYAILLSDDGKLQTQAFYDKDLNLMKELTGPNNYDPRTRPWYTYAAQLKQFSWTPLYHYYPSDKQGISATLPVYDSRGNLIMVIGSDLAAEVFSHFLSDGKPSPNGHALILGENGDTLFPLQKDEPLGKMAYSSYKEANNPFFNFIYKNTLYLSEIQPFPPLFHQ